MTTVVRLPRIAVAPMLAIAAMTGCVSLAPEARNVHITKDEADVRGCQLVQSLKVNVAAVGLVQVDEVMRNDAAAAGADTVLMLSRTYGQGAAYRCGSR